MGNPKELTLLRQIDAWSTGEPEDISVRILQTLPELQPRNPQAIRDALPFCHLLVFRLSH